MGSHRLDDIDDNDNNDEEENDKGSDINNEDLEPCFAILIHTLKGWDEGRYDGGDVGCLDVLPHLHLQLLLHHLHHGHLPQDSQQV